MKKLKIAAIVALLSASIFIATSAVNAQSVSTTVASTTATSTPATTIATTTPLTVGCYGSAATDTVAWSASASGGTPPYTFLWSGDPSVTGSTSTAMTSTYTATGTYNADIQATDAASSTATNNCSATVAILSSSSTPSSTIPDAGLQVTDNVDNAAPQEGGVVNYTITVSALGPATSTGVVATDTIPSGLTLVNATTSQGTYSTSTGEWDVGDLASSANATLTIQATVNAGTAGTTITNTANVSESPAVTNTSSATTSSASITIASSSSGGGGGGTGGGTTSSTPPAPTINVSVPPTFSIDANGEVSARGMLVTSVASDSFQGQIWGITYTVNWNGQLPQFFLNENAYGSLSSPSQQLDAGDIVGVSGLTTSSTPLTIDASVVRDYSLLSLRPTRFWGNGFGANGFGTGTLSGTGTDTVSTTTASGTTTSSLLSEFQVQLNNLTAEFQNLQQLFGQ